MTTTLNVETQDTRPRAHDARLSVLLILVLIGGLVAYKAIKSLEVLRNSAATGVFRPRTFAGFGEPAGVAGILTQSATYLAIVWPALIFGILIGASVRTLVSPRWIAERLGAGPLRLMFRTLLPNVMPIMLVQATLDMGYVMLSTAGLSFLGLGAQPPTPEWGSTILQSLPYQPAAWWYAAFPGLALASTALGFNLLGDGLRDWLDPTLRASLLEEGEVS